MDLPAMVRSPDHQPYDVLRELDRRGVVAIADIVDESGLNLMHVAIAEFKPDYLDMFFYAGFWEPLTRSTVGGVGEYAGLTARELCDRLVVKAKGPVVHETFHRHDSRDLSELEKVCLSGGELIIPTPLLTDGRCFLYAAAAGNTDIMTHLLAAGIPATAADETALHVAAKLGRVDAVRFVLDHTKCPVNATDADKNRAVDYAALNGDVDCLAAMVERGVKPDGRCLVLAAKTGRLGMVRYLTEKIGLSAGRDDRGRTPFLAACLYGGDLDLVKYLLRHGGSVEDRDNQSANCLHMLVNRKTRRQKEILSYLLEKEVAPLLNARDARTLHFSCMLVRGRDRNRDAWHYVSVHRHLAHQFLETLKTGKIDVKHFGRILLSGFGKYPARDVRKRMREPTLFDPDDPDMTPAHLAAYHDDGDALERLLRAGADPDIRDSEGNTVLHYAAMRGRSVVPGASAKVKNSSSLTPADVASANGHAALASTLRTAEHLAVADRVRGELASKLRGNLAESELESRRVAGRCVKRHAVEVLRDMTIDINRALLDLGGGPVTNPSDGTETRRRR